LKHQGIGYFILVVAFGYSSKTQRVILEEKSVLLNKKIEIDGARLG
jgi:hypothetical protein